MSSNKGRLEVRYLIIYSLVNAFNMDNASLFPFTNLESKLQIFKHFFANPHLCIMKNMYTYMVNSNSKKIGYSCSSPPSPKSSRLTHYSQAKGSHPWGKVTKLRTCSVSPLAPHPPGIYGHLWGSFSSKSANRRLATFGEKSAYVTILGGSLSFSLEIQKTWCQVITFGG